MHVRGSVGIEVSPRHCYLFWRDLENLPKFINHLESVEVLSERRSRWVIKTLGDRQLSWDAEIIRDEPNKIIGWRSLPGSAIATAGSIRFESEGWNRTRITVTMKYDPPAGVLGVALLELFGSAPEQQLAGDLPCFKELMERRTAA